MIKVIIADDHAMFVDGIEMLLKGADHIEIIGKAYTGVQLMNQLKEKQVDLILLDLDMPDMGGEEASGIIKRLYPDTKIIIVTMHGEPSFVRRLIELQVDGYLLKNTSRDVLVTAITRVSQGEAFFGEGLLQRAMQEMLLERNREQQPKPQDTLTEREIEIIKLTAKDMSIQEIADALFLSANTVKTHRRNIQVKLNLKTSLGIVKYAADNNLLD
ncbi:MAG: response regulator transcription factor [Bacteroidetes bacterium]|nr:response regulator transcription factor [Bacteroidota bacterium]